MPAGGFRDRLIGMGWACGRWARVLVAAVLCAAPHVPAVRAGSAAEVRVRSFELLNEGVSAYNKGDYAIAVDKLRESASMALNRGAGSRRRCSG